MTKTPISTHQPNAQSAQVSHPEGKVLHRLDVVQALLEADLVINLPKLKTHNLTGLTCAVKNLFGLVPGALKISYHAKLQERERFCAGLVDIFTFVKPALNIMDAINRMYPDKTIFEAGGRISAFNRAMGTDSMRKMLMEKKPVEEIQDSYQDGLKKYMERRGKYLLYK